MGETLAILAKKLVLAGFIGLLLTVGALTTLAISPAQAHSAHRCADVIDRPTDARCEYYTQVRAEFKKWDNDRYAHRYYEGASRKQAENLQLRAAFNACHGKLYEDFSCSGRVY